ncbi:MAG: hypothetical protein K9G11_00225 [Rickettsiaceae bacterium]|nr:hypothetical protein [Rickettsiaceae bacterium]
MKKQTELTSVQKEGDKAASPPLKDVQEETKKDSEKDNTQTTIARVIVDAYGSIPSNSTSIATSEATVVSLLTTEANSTAVRTISRPTNLRIIVRDEEGGDLNSISSIELEGGEIMQVPTLGSSPCNHNFFP